MNISNFICKCCGECCTPIVDLRFSDKIKLWKAGYRKFSERDLYRPKPWSKSVMKRAWIGDKKYCIFFDHEKKSCKIYGLRPKVCREYPFVGGYDDLDDCKPKSSFDILRGKRL